MSRSEIHGVVTDETPSPGSGEEAGAGEPREGDRLVEFFATSEHDRHMREMRPDWQQLLKLLPDNIPPRPGSPGVKFALWVWPSGFTVESEAYGTRATWESPVWSEASTLRRHAQELIDAAVPTLPMVPRTPQDPSRYEKVRALQEAQTAIDEGSDAQLIGGTHG